MRHVEEKFEAAIEADLLAAGWHKSLSANYSPDLGVDTAELFTFIGATQAKAWERLLGYHGGDPNTAQRKFAQRLAAELDARGPLDVLRHGVTDHGVKFRLAYFARASTITAELVALHEANRLTVTRQLRYSADQQRRARPDAVRQRHPDRDGRVEEPADAAERRARDAAVPARPQPV